MEPKIRHTFISGTEAATMATKLLNDGKASGKPPWEYVTLIEAALYLIKEELGLVTTPILKVDMGDPGKKEGVKTPPVIPMGPSREIH